MGAGRSSPSPLTTYQFNVLRQRETRAELPGGNSEWEPPDPFPNSEVKLLSADGSVGFPHVRVGHCQALIEKPGFYPGLFFCLREMQGWVVGSL